MHFWMNIETVEDWNQIIIITIIQMMNVDYKKPQVGIDIIDNNCVSLVFHLKEC